MTELSSEKLNWLENLMYKRDTFERQIAVRRYELEELAKKTPNVEKHPSVAVEINKFVMNMDVDPQLDNLVKRKKVIDRLFEGLAKSDEHGDLYKMAFIHYIECPYNSWQNTAEAICVSKSQVYRMRYTLLGMLAKQLGEI